MDEIKKINSNKSLSVVENLVKILIRTMYVRCVNYQPCNTFCKDTTEQAFGQAHPLTIVQTGSFPHRWDGRLTEMKGLSKVQNQTGIYCLPFMDQVHL